MVLGAIRRLNCAQVILADYATLCRSRTLTVGLFAAIAVTSVYVHSAEISFRCFYYILKFKKI